MTDDSLREQSNPYAPPQPRQAALAAAAGLGVISLAAWLAALAVGRFGEPGLLLIWLGGFLGGMAASKILADATSKAVGMTLAVACGAAVVFAEVYYIRFHLAEGEAGWLASIQLLPRFIQQFTMSALVGVLAAVFGGLSAYRQTAIRYRYLRVEA